MEKREGAFLKWKTAIKENLDKTNSWATTQEECYRLITQLPLDKNYIMAPNVIGPLTDKK